MRLGSAQAHAECILGKDPTEAASIPPNETQGCCQSNANLSQFGDSPLMLTQRPFPGGH